MIDIDLPRLDGIAATQQSKAKLPNLRVIMLTSQTTEPEIIAALSAGAEAYCVKGASVDRLLKAIASAVGATYLEPEIGRQVMNHLLPPTKAGNIANLSQSIHLLINNNC